MGDALRLLTTIPIPRGPNVSRAAPLFFPVVGLLIGMLWSLPGLLLGYQFSSAGVTAALVLLVDAAITGGRHLDALADVADGAASGHRDDEGIAVMRDPTVGAIGAAALILVCLLRYGTLTYSAEFGFRLFAAPIAGRTAMVLLLWWLPALQDGSLAHQLANPRWYVAAATGVVAVALSLVSGGRGVAAVGVGLGVAVVYGLWWSGRFGELSRDGIGAGGLLAETAALVVLAAH